MFFTSGTTGQAKGVVLTHAALIDRARVAAEMEGQNDSDVAVAYTAGKAVGPELLMFFRSIGINVKQLYGSTETSVFVCVQPDGQVMPDTVGPALSRHEVLPPAQALVVTPALAPPAALPSPP